MKMVANYNKWLVVIPARLASTRLANKPLQDLQGKPLIVRVYENLLTLKKNGAELFIATDSTEVLEACHQHDVLDVKLTRKDHQSGTDRSFEVAANQNRPFVLNVQGDEPFICNTDLMNLMMYYESLRRKCIATMAFCSKNLNDYRSSHVVKVVTDKHSKALFFSRAPIPFSLDALEYFQHHMGVYAYHVDVLSRFCELPPSSLEQQEKLEQLRALDNGIDIFVMQADHLSHGIDTQDDLERAKSKLA